MRRQLGDKDIELGHLLYAMYRKNPGPTRTVLGQAGITDETIVGALGLDAKPQGEFRTTDENDNVYVAARELKRLNTELLAATEIKELSEFPALSSHTRLAIERANELRAQRNDTEIRTRYLLEGALSVSECSVVRKLVTQHGVSFYLGEYENQESHARLTLPPVEFSLEHSEPVLLATIGRTSIFVQQTRAPWLLPVEAFALPTTSFYAPKGIVADDLEKFLGNDAWTELLGAIKRETSALGEPPAYPTMQAVPPEMRKRGCAPFVIVLSAPSIRAWFTPGGAIAQAYAAGVAVSRVTIPLITGSDVHIGWSAPQSTVDQQTVKELMEQLGLDHDSAVEFSAAADTIKAVLEQPSFGDLTAITLTTPYPDDVMKAVKTARFVRSRIWWEQMSQFPRNAWAWAAAAAGQKDGQPAEVSPFHLLAGLALAKDGEKRTPVSKFLLYALDQPEAPDDPEARVAARFGFPQTVTRIPLTILPPLDAECRAAVESALQLRPESRSGIHARDLVAGLLIQTESNPSPAGAAALKQRGFDLSRVLDGFVEYISGHVKAELDHWKAVVATAKALRLAPPTRPELSNDEVRGEIKSDKDWLDINGEVDRFAKLLVAEKVDPPIAIGLFGNWGSGKTFFMGLLRNRIKEITTGDPTYAANVAQIEFNAWHYVDTNLWASLAVHIFEGLAKELEPNQEDEIAATRRKLHSKIESSKRGQEQAERQQTRAKERRVAAGKELAAQQTAREAKAREWTGKRLARLWNAVINDNAFGEEKKQIEAISRRFGVGTLLDSAEDVQRLADEMRAVKDRAAGLTAAVRGRFSSKTTSLVTIGAVFLVIVAVALLGAGAEALRTSSEWLAQKIPGASTAILQVAALVTTGVAWASRSARLISKGLDKLEVLRDRLQAVDSTTDVSEEEAILKKEVEALDADIKLTTERITEADRRLKEAETELQRIDEGGLVYDFVKGRQQSSRYQEQLGLISTIRGDFEELGRVLDDLNKNGKRKIDRIILYIDDLDRCHPDKVVEVLQAVHLLLAFKLFNVVVGVDARWLERSLYRTYVGRTASAAMPGSRQGSQAFSPQNYLEKIFQIPYSLQGMSEGGFKKLVSQLVTSRSEHQRKAKEDSDKKARGGIVKPEPEAAGKEIAGAAGAASQRASSPGGESNSRARESGRDDAREIGAQGQTPAEGQPKPGDDQSEGQTKEGTGDEDGTPTNQQASGEAQAQARIIDEQQIEALFLEDWEEEYMKALHKFIPTPRLAKRFINVYRLLRVRATELDFAKFVGDASGGAYRAVLLLLAINIGNPIVGSLLLRLLASRRPQGAWNHFLAQINPETPDQDRDDWAKGLGRPVEQKKEFAKVLKHLAELVDKPGMPDDLDYYKRWAAEVGRYSFQWHISDADAEGYS
ncbi:MAG TPA: P-loop NTPase fold protein [Blastocatellia bacterium]|nr:P-loop NTPase fold protein [Blastocatellia bacterium]